VKNYVVGTNKVLAKVDSPVLEGWITVGSVKELQTYTDKEIDSEKYPGPVWKGSKFPADLMKQVIGTIHEFPKMETAYSLYYNITTGQWAVKCPEQNGAGASVSYKDDGDGMPEGFSIIGSIHTHPEMGAFWSGTDLNDQQKKHGIHFVFGLHDGMVRYSKVTVFTPTEQFDQDIHNVVEDFDWAQVYPAVPEWVETIKKQSYRRVYTYPTYAYKPKKTKYNTYAGYGYSGYHSGRSGSSWWGGYGGGWDAWEDAYGEDIDYDYDYTKPVTGTTASAAALTTDDGEIGEDNPYIIVFDEALADAVKSEQLRMVMVDQQTRSVIEHEIDLLVIDITDPTDIVEGIQEITSITGSVAGPKLTDEDERAILESVLDSMPAVNLIDSTAPTFRNAYCVDAIGALVNGLVDSYCENPRCIDSEDVSNFMSTLKDAYDTMLRIEAEKDSAVYLQSDKGEDEEGAEQC